MIDSKDFLVDTNVLMSPLTFGILIFFDKLNLIKIFLSQSVCDEYQLHHSKIPDSALKKYSSSFIDSNTLKDDISTPLKNYYKIKDKGDLHLIQFCITHNVSNILTFDKKAFYKSQIKKLNISIFHPDQLLLFLLSNHRIDLNTLFEELNLDPSDIAKKLKDANLKKLSQEINSILLKNK